MFAHYRITCPFQAISRIILEAYWTVVLVLPDEFVSAE